MKILLVIISLFASSIFCFSQQANNYTINGVIEKGFAYKIHLRYQQDTEAALGVDVDQVTDIINGKFSFTGTITQPVQAYLVLDGHSVYAPFYLDTGKITIKAIADREDRITESFNKIEITSIKGSFSDSLQRATSKIFEGIYKADHDDDVTKKMLYETALNFAKAYPNHSLSSSILSESYQLSYQQAKSIYDLLSPEQKQLSPRNGVDNELLRAQHLEKPYPFISLPDTTGTLYNGKTPSMKYLVLAFGRSRCEYCGQSNKELLNLYKRYSKKGLEILGVSTPFNREDWIAEINQAKLPWPQVSDVKGFDNAIRKYFLIPYDPYIILLDSTGKVIALNPGKTKLKRWLEQLLPN